MSHPGGFGLSGSKSSSGAGALALDGGGRVTRCAPDRGVSCEVGYSLIWKMAAKTTKEEEHY